MTTTKNDPLVDATAATIRALGYDQEDPHLAASPARIARFMKLWHTTTSDPPSMTTFPNESPRIDELVVCGGIRVYSMCAHHGLPFFGTIAIGYIPDKTLVGLSKLARAADHFAHRYQTQERLTHQVCEFLEEELQPKGIGVVMRAEHLCMAMRGVERPGATTVTSALRGLLKSDAGRAELLSLIKP